jgi:hypothetical protein
MTSEIGRGVERSKVHALRHIWESGNRTRARGRPDRDFTDARLTGPHTFQTDPDSPQYDERSQARPDPDRFDAPSAAPQRRCMLGEPAAAAHPVLTWHPVGEPLEGRLDGQDCADSGSATGRSASNQHVDCEHVQDCPPGEAKRSYSNTPGHSWMNPGPAPSPGWTDAVGTPVTTEFDLLPAQ